MLHTFLGLGNTLRESPFFSYMTGFWLLLKHHLFKGFINCI